MKRTRTIAALASGVALATMLTACGGGGQIGATAPIGADSIPADGIDDGTELTMWVRGALQDQARAFVDAYNERFDNQVALEIVPDEEIEALLGNAAMIGEMPDIVSGDVIRVPFWVENGMLQDITELIEDLPFYDALTRGGVDVGTTADGAKHTVPFITDVSVMVWNRDLYRQAGLDPDQGPRTLAEFREHAAAIQALNIPDVSGTYFAGHCGGCNVFTWFPHIWASGQEVMNPEGTEALFDSPVATQVLSELGGMVEDGSVGPGSAEETGATWITGFLNGQVGVMAAGNSVPIDAREAGLDVGVGPIPGLEEGQFATFLGGDALGLARDTANTAQAWHFINWTMSEEAQVSVGASRGILPVRTDLIDNEYAQADEMVSAINSVLVGGRTPVSRVFGEAFNAPTSPWLPLFRDVVFGGDIDSLPGNNAELTAILSQ